MTREELAKMADQLEAIIWAGRNLGDCERCKQNQKEKKGSYVKLGGEVEASVCEQCIRFWDDFAESSDEMRRAILAREEVVALHRLIDAGHDLRKELRTALLEKLGAEAAVRDMAQKWLGRKK